MPTDALDHSTPCLHLSTQHQVKHKVTALTGPWHLLSSGWPQASRLGLGQDLVVSPESPTSQGQELWSAECQGEKVLGILGGSMT